MQAIMDVVKSQGLTIQQVAEYCLVRAFVEDQFQGKYDLGKAIRQYVQGELPHIQWGMNLLKASWDDPSYGASLNLLLKPAENREMYHPPLRNDWVWGYVLTELGAQVVEDLTGWRHDSPVFYKLDREELVTYLCLRFQIEPDSLTKAVIREVTYQVLLPRIPGFAVSSRSRIEETVAEVFSRLQYGKSMLVQDNAYLLPENDKSAAFLASTIEKSFV